jgi:hypothetical protein
MRVTSLFTGCGGLDLGLQQVGPPARVLRPAAPAHTPPGPPRAAALGRRCRRPRAGARPAAHDMPRNGRAPRARAAPASLARLAARRRARAPGALRSAPSFCLPHIARRLGTRSSCSARATWAPSRCGPGVQPRCRRPACSRLNGLCCAAAPALPAAAHCSTCPGCTPRPRRSSVRPSQGCCWSPTSAPCARCRRWGGCRLWGRAKSPPPRRGPAPGTACRPSTLACPALPTPQGTELLAAAAPTPASPGRAGAAAGVDDGVRPRAGRGGAPRAVVQRRGRTQRLRASARGRGRSAVRSEHPLSTPPPAVRRCTVPLAAAAGPGGARRPARALGAAGNGERAGPREAGVSTLNNCARPR